MIQVVIEQIQIPPLLKSFFFWHHLEQVKQKKTQQLCYYYKQRTINQSGLSKCVCGTLK